MHIKTDKMDFLKSHHHFFANQVDMKNVVECWKEFFCLFQFSRNIGCEVYVKHGNTGCGVFKGWIQS